MTEYETVIHGSSKAVENVIKKYTEKAVYII